ncbi:stage III sporulation protein AF [Evansella cellulosilytica]|uniref:Stage III sporulation protein AF n=1 Tax=Evansella cellulosilytica (strain ATCC 21833 / DSM 2522 / FERM P-1141 / JCM 9156 / N-4) TaxID=649639 RepID=E6TXP3_EVAC2|nr:stage III sporulation protein AF [Evansella cellulosilytica]ADU29969.1 stage III sporulation protein AF [Evansella cellulosilytica DSM 2522]
MGIITSWITNIILLILFATILELLLPNSKMQRYVKLVVGLMLLMVMLNPILSIFQNDPEAWLDDISSWTNEPSEQTMSSMDAMQSEIEKENLARISEQVAVQLKNVAAKELEQQYEVVIRNIYLEFETFQEDEDLLDHLSDVDVFIQSLDEFEKEENEIKVVTIDPVEIMKEEKSIEEKEGIGNVPVDDIAELLSSTWAIPNEKIHVHVKSGADRDE